MTVGIYIHGEFDIDAAVEWAIENCSSFVSYKLIELGWEEKLQRDCWFRFDVLFDNEKDATLFQLRWG